ncbi:MAG TPA: hypothetical protein VFY52_01815 [Thermoleophilaceae bacterium]|nr:hypothetical protein [Thermoleophilaceae bacterium]
MAISRPFLLALLGALLLGATFFAVQSSRDSAGDDAAPAAQQSQPAEQAAAPATPAASPEELLQNAFRGGDIDSAAFDATVSGRSDATGGRLELSGAFELGAANDVPEFEIDFAIAADGNRAQGGFVSLGDEAFFTRGDTGWRVPDEAWTPLVEAVASGAGAQPQNFVLPFDPQAWIRDVESEGTETLDGVETTHISASVDVERVFEDVAGLARRNGAPLPSARDAARTVERAEFDVWVGNEDRVIRRLSADVAFAPPPELRAPNDSERTQISFDLELTGVNQPQEIEAPANVRQGMPGGELGRLAEGIVTGLSGLGGGEPVSLAALTSRDPQRAARAVADGRKVVILFENPDGLDDRAMRGVVRQLDARTRALVLTDDVGAVDRYGSMVEDLGVSQTPAVVLIDSRGTARLIEGYVDTDTLAQAVADAR